MCRLSIPGQCCALQCTCSFSRGNGKANLSAPAPRASDRKPDRSGVWQIEPPPTGEIERMIAPAVGAVVVPGDDPREFSKYCFNILADFKPEDAPMLPEAAERLRKRHNQGPIISTESHCLPMGIPRANLISVPFKIIQAPRKTVIMYQADNSRNPSATKMNRTSAISESDSVGLKNRLSNRCGVVNDATLIRKHA
jgi:hypothetical protein